jgi:hypothetical protein
MMSREVEHRTTSACTIERSTLAIPSTTGAEELGVGVSGGGWKLTTAATATTKQHEDDELFEQMANDAINNGEGQEVNSPSIITVECQSMSQGTTVRIPPMERSHRGWHTDHFHTSLKLPDTTTTSKVGTRGIIVLLQARSSECLAVALSPTYDYELGKTYVVHYGADGNTRTVLRRHINYNECIESSISSRVCSDVTWISYWICLQSGILSAGLGTTPGQYCIGILDDTMYDALRSGIDAVRYVGIGNSALRRNARDVRVRNVIVCGIPSHFGLEGLPIVNNNNSRLINIDSLFGGGEKIVIDNHSGGMPTDEELLAEYDKERLKAKARAAKFGIEYIEPAAEAFLKWSEARRLRANPEKGFITGIDTFSTEELAKADARRLRFAKPGDDKKKKKKRKGGGGDDEDGEEGDDDDDEGDENRNDNESDDEAMNDDDNKDDVAEWEKTKQDPLPVEQAWENWKLVKRFRIDPPQSLLLPTTVDLTTTPNTPVVSVIPTKIHVFAIDWACFKQIRTDDIMSYFKDYGPSYVEWLGELSCNVHFEDRHTAARAFRALSRELPTPPPSSISVAVETSAAVTVDSSIKGWARDADGNFILDELGRRTFASDDVVGDGVPMGDGDVVDVTITENGNVGEKDLLPDFASLGWRFCKWTVRKVSNDRYGKRGTRARVLMRLATSIDVLDDRPTEWPKPPPGFTTKRVLMPWHDFSGKRRGGGGGGGGRRGENNKRRKRGSEGKGGRRSNGGGQRDVPVEERMSTGLRAGR